MTETIQNIINVVKNIPTLKIEIIGSWLWVSGQTFDHKKVLRGLNLKFSGNKKAWYYHEGSYSKRGKKSFSMTDIRHMHGSETIKESRNVIAA